MGHRIIQKIILIFTLFLVASCSAGGGSGENGSGGYQAPYIYAELDSFPTGSAPLNYQSAHVLVIDATTGDPISATVTVNGTPLAYDSVQQEYIGNPQVAPGATVSLIVSVGDNVYTAEDSQFATYPTLSTPSPGTTWNAILDNPVTWSCGTPATNSIYGLGVLDATDPYGPLVWPSDNSLQTVTIDTTSYAIPGNSLTTGDRFVLVGIAKAVVVPNAAPESSLIIAGFNYVPITIILPTTLASGLSEPWEMAVDSTSIYWTEYLGGTVKKIGINGGTVTTLASGLNSPMGIAADSTSVYWTESSGGNVKKVIISSGTITTLASGLNSPAGIAVDSTSVYWTEFDGGTLKKVGINGGTVTTLASGLNAPARIAVDSTGVYWTENYSGTVKKLELNSGTTTTLASGLNGPWSIAIDSMNVYWTVIGNFTSNGAIQKVGINGGPVTTLASGLNAPEGITVDSTSVYWTDGSAGTVNKVEINGGTVTPITAQVHDPQGIAVDSTSVYWIQTGGYANNGAIQKIPK